MRRALIVGIDHYENTPLQGCVNDASYITEVLAKNQDGSPNFSCKKLISTEEQITRARLRENLKELFEHKSDVALFYFAGHGMIGKFGGYLVTQDFKENDEGVAMLDVLSLANQSKIDEVIIILDCCHSGAFGVIPALQTELAYLREEISVLCASRLLQAAVEKDGGGIFTALICAGLNGGAADLIGNVTVGSLYAFVDKALGPWNQRPLFKSHVSRLLPIRKCDPAFELSVLRLLTDYFKNPDDQFYLDPSYEPGAEPRHKEHAKIFGHLQRYRGARLLVPVGERNLYYATINSKSCQLTDLGRYYWKLVKEGMI